MAFDKLDRALADLRGGRFALVYDADGREEETDFVALSILAKPRHLREMRTAGGGLICQTVHPEAARRLGLPRMVDLFEEAKPRYRFFHSLVPQNLPYDCRSSFSITINHRSNYTGITDIDRARTIGEFGKLSAELCDGTLRPASAPREFWSRFRSPGHVHLLIASDGLLAERQGHTELATCLAEMAGSTPSAAICEMLGGRGRAMPRREAKAYASLRDFQFLEGREVLEGWKRWSG
jgi:3,4-dihydroxy 2-butanone 4-phosphate synthase